MIKFGEKYKNDDILPYILKICDGTNNILKIIVTLPLLGEKGSEVSNTGDKELDEILKESYPVLINYNEISWKWMGLRLSSLFWRTFEGKEARENKENFV